MHTRFLSGSAEDQDVENVMDAAEFVEQPYLPLRSGSSLGRYCLLCPIARGGMGEVWAARQNGPLGLPQVVAIKIAIPIDPSRHDQIQQYLFDEAQVAASIDHPNVCKILELGSEGGTLFIAMELLQGVSLSTLLSTMPGRKLEFRTAAHLVAQACSGLHAAHELTDDDGQPLEVVHRDATPHNLFVTSAGELKVMDFGIVKSRNQLHQATQTGELKGKVTYVSPEQLRGKHVDRRADVFALGAVLYTATLGRSPFSAPGDDAGAAILRISQGDYPSPSHLDSQYPPELEAIINRALALDPADRFASAEELRLALQSYVDAGSRPVTRDEIAALVKKQCGVLMEQRRTEIRKAQKLFDPRSYGPSSGTFNATGARDTATTLRPPDSSNPREDTFESLLESQPPASGRTRDDRISEPVSRGRSWAWLAGLVAASSALTLLLLRLFAPSAPSASPRDPLSASAHAAPASSAHLAPSLPATTDTAAHGSTKAGSAERSADPAPESGTVAKNRGAKRPVVINSSKPAGLRGSAAAGGAGSTPAKSTTTENAPFSETVTRRPPARHAIDESDPFAK